MPAAFGGLLLATTMAVGIPALPGLKVRATSEPPAATAAPASSPPLQFRSHGRLLGFTEDRMYAAGMDYVLVEEFVGAHRVRPQAAPAVRFPEGTGAPPLESVTYPHLWDGITVSYATNPAGLAQSTYRIDPGADPARIRLRYNTDVALQPDGSLRVQHPAVKGYFTLSPPQAWQELGGRRVPVPVAFTRPDGRVVGFTVGAYDPTHPLLIDPTYAWHTFHGSGALDVGYSLAVDDGGNVYVAGESDASWGTPLHPHSGGPDIVVLKYDADGALLWHTFYGSSSRDLAAGIAVEGGHVYVTGTSSATWGTPLRPFVGYDDIVVMKLDSDGTHQWHTFLGAGTWDLGSGIAVLAGAVYVAGTSWETWGAPVHPHGTNGWDSVVLKLNSAGALQWHTFAGANPWNYAYGIAVDGGAVYATGKATGSWGTPLHPYSGGPSDLFVLKLTGTGAYQWHTYYGAVGGYHEGAGVAVDEGGNILVTGTSSASWGTPLRPFGGQSDMAVLKLDSAGTLLWHTFLGGTNQDAGYGVAMGGDGTVYVTGGSFSSWGAPIHAHAGYGWDILAVALDDAGTYQWHTFYGANAYAGSDPGDVGRGIATDGTGKLYVTGYSTATWGAPLHPYSGNRDIALLKLDTAVLANLTLKKSVVAGCKPVTGTVTLSAPAPAGGTTVALSETLASGSVPATVTVPAGATSKTFKVTTTARAVAEDGTVSVSYGGVTLSEPLRIRPISVLSLPITPTTLVGGGVSSGVVKLECKAAPGPILVEFGSTLPAVASTTVPSVLIAAGAQTAPVTVTTSPVTATKKPKITAAANGVTKSKTLTVTP
jgi:hypothetical protein